MFRLLEPANSSTPPDSRFIDILGKSWVVCEYAKISDAPAYTCISYAWGDEKADNLLDNKQLMSARTIPTIEATIIATHSQKSWADNIKFSHKGDAEKEEAGQAAAVKASQALWIDALCVPFQEPARKDCLQSMGEIFSSAFQVVVVLTKQCSDLIQDIRRTGTLNQTELLALESEDWVNRVWTYQEAVNSRSMFFIVEDDSNAMLAAQDFLRSIVDATEEYKKKQKLDKIGWVKHHPSLYNLEMLLADYMIADFAERSAYQVMSVMGQRVAERPEDYFYAMIGSITTKSSDFSASGVISPSEYFMRVCEAKGDFSFIFSTAPRSRVLGQRWRPVDDSLTAVLPSLLTFGGGEGGHPEATHLQLNNMFRLIPGAISEDGLKAASWFMDPDSKGLSPNIVAAGILQRLRGLGFTGCGDYFEFETGFFFPTSKVDFSGDFFAIVSSDIHWVTGGPGLILRSNDTDIDDFHDVGAFVGRSPKSGKQFNIG